MKYEKMIGTIAEEINPNIKSLFYVKPSDGEDNTRVLAIVEEENYGFMRKLEKINDHRFEFLFLEKSLFESDVEDSRLLEIFASMLLLLHGILIGEKYSSKLGKIYRKRKLLESLKNLLLEHPHLYSELLVDPRYFVYDILLRSTNIYPQALEALIEFEEEKKPFRNEFIEALRELEKNGFIRFKDGFVSLDTRCEELLSEKKNSPSSQLKQMGKNVQNLSKLGLTGFVELVKIIPGLNLLEGFGLGFKSSKEINPKRFLYFPTEMGLSSISESLELDKVLERLNPSKKTRVINLSRIGSAFNEVYLLEYEIEKEGSKAVMKRYPTLGSLKWAPLSLWTLGTQNFSILGKSRMERECATINYLTKIGINVPKILYTSFEDRILLRDYMEGENVSRVIRNAANKDTLGKWEKTLMTDSGDLIGKIHAKGATLGDCKPENFIATKDGLCIIDLEQGAKSGNKTWDVAEFLYLSGSNVRTLSTLNGIEEIARSFIEGYLAGGGTKKNVTESANIKYTKVFVPVVLPNVLLHVSKICREV